MSRDLDAHPILGPLLANPPEECRPVAELYRYSAGSSRLEQIPGERGGPFFVFCEQLGMQVFDEDLDVSYEEVIRLDEEAEGLLRLALLAHQEHPDAVEDYAARLCWAQRS